MNVQHAPTAIAESRERHSYARLQGRWLLLAQGVWLTLVVLTLAIAGWTFFVERRTWLRKLGVAALGTVIAQPPLTLLTPGLAENQTMLLGILMAFPPVSVRVNSETNNFSAAPFRVKENPN